MDTMLKESVAVLFSHLIKVHNKDLNAERPLFCRFMKQNFAASEDEVNTLFDKVMAEDDYNIDTHISMIANGLVNETYTKMSVLKQLNHIILKSKLVDEDYDLFDKVKHALFPQMN